MKSGQEPGDRDCSRDHRRIPLVGWFFLAGLVCFLIHQGHLSRGDGSTHNGLDPPTSIINQEKKSSSTYLRSV